ncbi:MAG: MBL fold metallo-hydrolase [Acidobacteriota bacterium]|jgi:glyoxylase-like metal-dependent hydrolase (beta-lactamase superfamily II)
MSDSFSRRSLFAGSFGCAGHLLASLEAATAEARRGFAVAQLGEVVREQPFGRLERLADGVWALVSTPLQARTTLSNGGIVAGSNGVLVIEGFASVEGAQWMAMQARQLTGSRPSHVVLTHYHSDHSGGLAGYRNDADLPLVLHTATTRALLEDSLRGRDTGGAESPVVTLVDEALVPESGEPLRVDLGGRVVTVRARGGHTPSDLSVKVEDPRVVFCGDLMWNGMFPNYVDAIPTRLATACKELFADSNAIYVPGHGALAEHAETQRYVELIEDVGEAARAAIERGLTPAEGAAEYSVPESLGEWFMFSPRYYEVAFTAWQRELAG